VKDYSQYGEGAFLRKYFSNGGQPYSGGVLVDVGAKGRSLSNTYALIEGGGWEALLFEPLPEHYLNIRNDFHGLPGVHTVNAAVSSFTGKADFYIHDTKGHSSLGRKTDNCIQVRVVMLPDMLDEYGFPLDFDLLSVDTEGHDNVIISHLLTESRYRPKVIVFEKSACVDMNLLKRLKYKKIYETGANGIYAI